MSRNDTSRESPAAAASTALSAAASRDTAGPLAWDDAPSESGASAANVVPSRPLGIAVLVPCYNEAPTVAAVVAEFRAALGECVVYVYDNGSTDDTAAIAHRAGAVVRHEPWPGKGNVIRRMFADVEADVYLLVDGDGTYASEFAPAMVRRLVDERLDMVVGTRARIYETAHRPGHGVGNRIFNFLYRRLFGDLFTDVFSGYRVFSRRFVKSFPASSSGFEIETEIAVQASQLRMPVAEVETPYRPRDAGSSSKLRTVRDGVRIFGAQLLLFKAIRPVSFYGAIAAALAVLATVLAIPIFVRFVEQHDVPRFPTAILATGLMILAGMSLLAGVILDSVAAGRLEQKRLAYLRLPHGRDG